MPKNYISNRTVAFIDVLAFKHILSEFQLKKVGDVLSDAIAQGIQLNKDDKIHNYQLQSVIIHNFSDSIFVYSLDDSENGCLSVIKCVHRLFQMLILYQFPARAGIAFGEAYINSDKNIRIGANSFSRAYELEQSQDWIGGIIDVSIEKKFPALLANLLEVIKYLIPFRENSELLELEEIKYAINWLHGIGSDPVDPIDILKHFPNMFGQNINIKLKNTIKFLEHTKRFYGTLASI